MTEPTMATTTSGGSESSGDAAAIQRALAAGQLSVTDPATGYHKSMYAPCPADGQLASVWRVERGPQHAITGLIMRCSRCGTEFRAPPETLILH
jgi:hypothetical protein